MEQYLIIMDIIWQYLSISKVFTTFVRILSRLCFSETFWIINYLISCTSYRGAFAPKNDKLIYCHTKFWCTKKGLTPQYFNCHFSIWSPALQGISHSKKPFIFTDHWPGYFDLQLNILADFSNVLLSSSRLARLHPSFPSSRFRTTETLWMHKST